MSYFSRASPPPAICVCSLVALLLHRERDEKISAVFSLWGQLSRQFCLFCATLCCSWQIAVIKKPSHTLSVPRVPLISFQGHPAQIFFSPAKSDLVYSINPVIFPLTFFAHQIIFAHDKVLLKVLHKCATLQGRVYLLFHWVQSTSHSVENVVETFSLCHQSN